MIRRLLRRVVGRLPSFTIVGPDGPYMTRYFLVKTARLAVYIHQIHRSDADRAFHDHPWSFISIMLAGQYCEWISHRRGDVEMLRRGPSSIGYRHFTTAHRLELAAPVWTLVIRGRDRVAWGFYEAGGWIHFVKYAQRAAEWSRVEGAPAAAAAHTASVIRGAR